MSPIGNEPCVDVYVYVMEPCVKAKPWENQLTQSHHGFLERKLWKSSRTSIYEGLRPLDTRLVLSARNFTKRKTTNNNTIKTLCPLQNPEKNSSNHAYHRVIEQKPTCFQHTALLVNSNGAFRRGGASMQSTPKWLMMTAAVDLWISQDQWQPLKPPSFNQARDDRTPASRAEITSSRTLPHSPGSWGAWYECPRQICGTATSCKIMTTKNRKFDFRYKYDHKYAVWYAPTHPNIIICIT